jgi:hypothetical protein
MFYQNKYLKYKEKYLNLKNQLAGTSKKELREQKKADAKAKAEKEIADAKAKAEKEIADAKINTYVISSILLQYQQKVCDEIRLLVNPHIYLVECQLNNIIIKPILPNQPKLSEELNQTILKYLVDAETKVNMPLTILCSQNKSIPFTINGKKLIVNNFCNNTVFRGIKYVGASVTDTNIHTNSFVFNDNINNFIQVRDCDLTFHDGLLDKITEIFNPRNKFGELLKGREKLEFVPDNIYRWEIEGESSSTSAAGGGKILRKCIKCDIISEYNRWFVDYEDPILKNNQCMKCRHSSYDIVRDKQEFKLKLSPDQFDKFKKEIEYMLMKITNPREKGPGILHSFIPEEPPKRGVDDYSQIYDFEWDLLEEIRESPLPTFVSVGNIFQRRIQDNTVCIRQEETINGIKNVNGLCNKAVYITNGEGISTIEKINGDLIWEKGKICIKNQLGENKPLTFEELKNFFQIFEIKKDIIDTTFNFKYTLCNHALGPFLKLDFDSVKTISDMQTEHKKTYSDIIGKYKPIEIALQDNNEDDFNYLTDHDFYYTEITLSNDTKFNVGTLNILTGINKENSLCLYKEVPYDFKPADTEIKLIPSSDNKTGGSTICFPMPEMYKRIEFLVKKIDKLMTKHNIDVLLIQESSLYFHEAWTSFNNNDYGNVICEQTKKSMLGGPGIIWRKTSLTVSSFKGYRENIGKPTCVSLDCTIIKGNYNKLCTIASIHGSSGSIIWSGGKLFDYFLNDNNTPKTKLIFGGDFNLKLNNYYNFINSMWLPSKVDNKMSDELIKKNTDISEPEKYYYFLNKKIKSKKLVLSNCNMITILDKPRKPSYQIDHILNNLDKRAELLEEVSDLDDLLIAHDTREWSKLRIKKRIQEIIEILYNQYNIRYRRRN